MPRPCKIPHELEASFEEAVKTQLLNHPFLGDGGGFVNDIFGDLASALVLHRTDDESFRKALLRKLRADGALSSPALGPFIISLADSQDVPAQLFSIVIGSVASREDASTDYRFELVGEGNRADLRITSISQGQPNDAATIGFHSTDLGLSMPARVKNFRGSELSEVTFASSAVRIGPDVDISAGAIFFQGAEIHVDASVAVELDAESVLADWQQREYVHGSELIVIAEEAEGWPSRWLRKRFRSEDAPELEQYLLAFRRFLKSFRKTQHVGQGELAANREELESRILKHDARVSDIADVLRQRGWLSSVGPDYLLPKACLQELETTAAAVRRYEFSATMSKFLKKSFSL